MTTSYAPDPTGGWSGARRGGIRGSSPAAPEELTLLGRLERAITDGTEPESSGRDNLQTVALLEACARSASEGRWISPQELFHEPL